MEIQLQIRDTFESVILTEMYPRSQIDIYLQLMQSDGGQVQACINAATLALINAGIAMRDYVVACSVGNVNGSPILGSYLNWMKMSYALLYKYGVWLTSMS
jgi:exosome complex component RRP41